MLIPLDVQLLETEGAVPLWPLILLGAAAVLVIFFIIVELARILRRRPPVDDPRQDADDASPEDRS
ncbi:hypothetical protein [Tessaracoccus sp. ZS01]|uniref:hypothetical protein n=1 Tax=Tessaracoccus sp. ZS01 TaxID=1906324 RepID=UPI00096DF3A9|nr:hypothetical protein [Tessaracoccus sp. ZS01]MCG6568500.1 hypothetical protein [Tessaracoccus sp. ZS01]OMG52683.1 hypothetical protein BJN44_12840 [Tessaracoccus sp. ZS01]